MRDVQVSCRSEWLDGDLALTCMYEVDLPYLKLCVTRKLTILTPMTMLYVHGSSMRVLLCIRLHMQSFEFDLFWEQQLLHVTAGQILSGYDIGKD